MINRLSYVTLLLALIFKHPWSKRHFILDAKHIFTSHRFVPSIQPPPRDTNAANMARQTKKQTHPACRSARLNRQIPAPIHVDNTISDLLGLPAELRNRIYDLVIEQGQEIRLHTPGQLPTREPSIAQVNQLLRQEALPIWRLTNKWIILDSQGYWIRRWLAAEKLSSFEDSTLEITLKQWCKSCEPVTTGYAAMGSKRRDCEYSLQLRMEKRTYSMKIVWELDRCREFEIEEALTYEKAKGWMVVMQKITGKEVKEDPGGLQVRGFNEDREEIEM